MPKNNSILDDLANLDNQPTHTITKFRHHLKWHLIHLFFAMVILLLIIILYSFFPYSGFIDIFSILLLIIGSPSIIYFVCRKCFYWQSLTSLLNSTLIFMLCFFCISSGLEGSLLQQLRLFSTVDTINAPLLKSALATQLSYCFLVSIVMEFNNLLGILIQKRRLKNMQ